MLAIFDGPARAARCGLAIRDSAHHVGISVRAGVHTGECERLSDDLAGVAVHIAARTCALADGEEVMATRTVRDLAVGSMLRFDPRGTRELKGVPARGASSRSTRRHSPAVPGGPRRPCNPRCVSPAPRGFAMVWR